MKFFAFSLIGLGLLAQQTQAGYDDYMNSAFTTGLNVGVNTQLNTQLNNQLNTQYNNGLGGSLINYGTTAGSTLTATTDSITQNLQNILSGLNVFGTPSTVQPTIPTFNYGAQVLPIQTISGITNNLQTELSQSLNFKNPFENFDPTKWILYDNQQKFCTNPRVWDGKSCKCKNNGMYVSGKCYYDKPQQTNKDLLSLKHINRNFDGTENNPTRPEWGAKSAQLLRICPANYQDGKSKMWEHMPNPRDISNLVGDIQGTIKESKLGLNMLFTIWGQFLDHDITLTPTTADQQMNIPIPRCDKVMDKTCSGTQEFPITRSIFNPNAQVRTNINVLTPWIDASQVYGSDKETANGLREFKNGKLKSSTGNLLPKDQTGGFVAGDFRVNENVALTVFQTLFMREHNRICDVVVAKNPTLTDEEIFQIARNYVIGLVQHITYDQYLPALLGKANFDALIGPYQYDPNSSPNIHTEFSSAAFRLGHPLINSPFKLMDNFGNVIKTLQLGEMFFNPSLVTSDSVTQFLNGLARTSAKERSLELVNDLRNFLFFPPNGEVKLDLFTFNVQRGRDHGVCSLSDARQKMGLPKKSFKDLFEDQNKAKCLQKIFHDPSNVDLWLGIIGEKSEPGSVLGELGIRLNAFQFKKIRNGDRFWYENVYPDYIVKQIKATSFADVIKRNTGVKYLSTDSFKKYLF